MRTLPCVPALTCSVALIAVLVSGCASKEAEIARVVKEFVPLEARAIDLRQARFALADSIRFAQTRLMELPADSPERAEMDRHISEFLKDKEVLLNQSLALADTVKASIEVLLSGVLQNETDRDRFYKLLNAELKSRGYQVDKPAG